MTETDFNKEAENLLHERTKKSQVDSNVYKIATDKFFDFNLKFNELFALASKALRKNDLLKDVLSYYYIDELDYYSKESKLVIQITVQPFFKQLKEQLYKRSGLHPSTVFVFSFVSHF